MNKYKKLRVFNLVMGILHLIQGVLMYGISNTFSLPITTSYLQFDIATGQLAPYIETLGKLQIAPVISIFLLLSALAHIILTLPTVFEWYTSNLKKGVNYARWYEYMLSSSLMMVVISMLVGVYDLSSLILIFSINASMILFGLVMEIHNQTTEKVNWTSYIAGCFAGIIPWVVVALYLFNSGEGDYKAPDFVYWIFFSIFLFFNTFALNMFLQYKKTGKWKEYRWGEVVYIILSLLAKSLLAWQVFAGTLRPV